MPALDLLIEEPSVVGLPAEGNLVLDPPLPGLNRVLLRRLFCWLRVPPVPGAKVAYLDTGARGSPFSRIRFGSTTSTGKPGRDFDELSVAGIGTTLTGQAARFRYLVPARGRGCRSNSRTRPEGLLRSGSIRSCASSRTRVVRRSSSSGLWAGAFTGRRLVVEPQSQLRRPLRRLGVLTCSVLRFLPLRLPWTSAACLVYASLAVICNRPRPPHRPGATMNDTSPNVPHTNTTDGGSQCHVALLDGPSVTVLGVSGNGRALAPTMVHEVPDSVAELDLVSGTRTVARRGPIDGGQPRSRTSTPRTVRRRSCPTVCESVLRGHDESDNWVSRGAFHAPRCRRAAGSCSPKRRSAGRAGLRLPLNGTKLLLPTVRWLDPGEEVLIGLGEAVAIRLPNRLLRAPTQSGLKLLTPFGRRPCAFPQPRGNEESWERSRLRAVKFSPR